MYTQDFSSSDDEACSDDGGGGTSASAAPPPPAAAVAGFRLNLGAMRREEVDDGRLVMALADGAPAELEFAADASTAFPRLIYSLLGTYAGAEVMHKSSRSRRASDFAIGRGLSQ